jgi:hypothetical protein
MQPAVLCIHLFAGFIKPDTKIVPVEVNASLHIKNRLLCMAALHSSEVEETKGGLHIGSLILGKGIRPLSLCVPRTRHFTQKPLAFWCLQRLMK